MGTVGECEMANAEELLLLAFSVSMGMNMVDILRPHLLSLIPCSALLPPLPL